MSMPLLRTILEDLQQGRSDIVLGVQPGKWRLRVKGSVPFKTAIRHQLHLEQRIRETGEIVVVDPRIDKRRGQTQLPHVILDGEFGRPLRNRRPGPVDGVIGHAAVNIVGDGAGAFGGVGEGAADGDLVPGLRDGVDKRIVGALEEGVHERGVIEEGTLQEGNIGQSLELFGDQAFERMDLRAHRISDSGGDPDERGRLSPSRIHHGYRFLRLCHTGSVGNPTGRVVA